MPFCRFFKNSGLFAKAKTSCLSETPLAKIENYYNTEKFEIDNPYKTEEFKYPVKKPIWIEGYEILELKLSNDEEESIKKKALISLIESVNGSDLSYISETNFYTTNELFILWDYHILDNEKHEMILNDMNNFFNDVSEYINANYTNKNLKINPHHKPKKQYESYIPILLPVSEVQVIANFGQGLYKEYGIVQHYLYTYNINSVSYDCETGDILTEGVTYGRTI